MNDSEFPPVNFKDEEVTVLSDNNGNSVNVIEYDGYYLSKKAIEKGRIPDPRSNIPNIIKMEIRPDDVFLVAYPKAGTHWTWEVTSMLMQDGKEQNLSKEVAMLPFVTPEKIDELPSPRLMNSHCYFKHLPQEILKKKNKIIFVNRNPKDVAVSFYHHCQHVADYKGTFSQFLDFFMSERVYHCAWYKYMLDWERVFKQHPELPVLYVNYEDLHKEPMREIDRIATFLDVRKSEEFYSKISKKCSFSELKQSYKKRNNMEFMFRKGAVGDWKNCFTVTDNERFDNYLKEKLPNPFVKFTFCI
ncbi:Hypothetical predicted protein [Mytilus galloprovincialis]|uniref:Sulfotransferase domain-containing protein n=1 Tax=Mytilus galloprovincialis TaxID=29158 RepID=A0A8B6CAV8_MYTGA|nr:Hypothetical predicted protein [Mytilus galloprovincialis]